MPKLPVVVIKLPEPDLHVKKAMEIFGVPADQVTPEMRNIAKLRNHAELYSHTYSPRKHT